MTAVLLTGATGLLGRYLLRDLLLAGHEVIVLARSGNDGTTARQRVDEALRQFESRLQHTLPRPIVMEGSLHQSGLGLSHSDRQWLGRHRPAVLHCAASIKFHRDGIDDEPYLSNVTGTDNLLALCSSEGLRRFHYVSTAYVCGDRKGLIFETDFNKGQKFRNDYEQSKYLSEQNVRDAGFLDGPTIYRPSIIVGDSQTAYTSTFHGYYLPLQLAYAATVAGVLKADGQGYMEAIGIRGHERKNIVPVDWVSVAMVHVLQRPSLHGRTYHLTNRYPVTTSEIETAITAAIRESIATSSSKRSTSSSPFNMDDFREQMKVYADYLSDDPDFDTSNLDQQTAGIKCPKLEHETLLQLARYAIRVNFGWPRSRWKAPDVDVHSIMKPFIDRECSHAEIGLRLEVSGSCGGVWYVVFDRNMRVTMADKPNGPCDLSAYMNVHTFQDILHNEHSIQTLTSSGRIVLEGAGPMFAKIPELLEVLFSQLHERQWGVPGAAMDEDSPN